MSDQSIVLDSDYLGIISVLDKKRGRSPIVMIWGPVKDKVLEYIDSKDYTLRSETMVDHGDYWVVTFSGIGTGYKLGRLNYHSSSIKTHNMFDLPKGVYPIYMILRDDRVYMIVHKRKVGEVKRGTKDMIPMLKAYETIQEIAHDIWRLLQ